MGAILEQALSVADGVFTLVVVLAHGIVDKLRSYKVKEIVHSMWLYYTLCILIYVILILN